METGRIQDIAAHRGDEFAAAETKLRARAGRRRSRLLLRRSACPQRHRKLILVDGDIVAPSNLNRQIMAQFDTVGQPKTAVMKERIHTYRSDIQITCHQRFYDKEANAQIFSEPVDFVVDAIDYAVC